MPKKSVAKTAPKAVGKKASWFEKGWDNADMKDRTYVNRFYVKVDEPKKIIFLDDEPFSFHEHNLYQNGKWFNFYTCTGEDCPCQGHKDVKTRSVAALTVLEQYKNKEGKMVWGVKLFVAPLATRKALAKYAGKMVGHIFLAVRFEAKSPACGTQFTHLGKSEMPADKFKAFDYEKILAPDPVGLARALKSQVSDAGAVDEKEEEVAF